MLYWRPVNTIRCWDVFLIDSPWDINYNHTKFFVAIYSDQVTEFRTPITKWWGFYINSKQQVLPDLHACQAGVEAATHSFLTHTSWLHVNTIREYPETLLTEQIGTLALPCQRAVIKAVESCKALKQKYKQRVLEELKSPTPK